MNIYDYVCNFFRFGIWVRKAKDLKTNVGQTLNTAPTPHPPSITTLRCEKNNTVITLKRIIIFASKSALYLIIFVVIDSMINCY